MAGKSMCTIPPHWTHPGGGGLLRRPGGGGGGRPRTAAPQQTEGGGARCSALAEGYPERPVRLVVPQAAGSATDTVARILAAELPNQLGQLVVVENKPGGALTIGLDFIAKSAPDGYTIGMGPVGALAITRHMVAKLPYDIERDFQPIALATRGHLLLAVSPSLPADSLQELIEYARKNPGKLMNASSSNGSPGHVGGELFKYMTGTQIVQLDLHPRAL